jgi:hypothetical protein
VKDLLVSLIHSTYKCFNSNTDHSDESRYGKIIPETYFVQTQLPAFIGRHQELEANDLPPVWAVSYGNQPSTLMPYISDDLEWILRLSEHGTIIQKYQRRPMTFEGRKAMLRLTVCVSSMVPLQAYVCKKV